MIERIRRGLLCGVTGVLCLVVLTLPGVAQADDGSDDSSTSAESPDDAESSQPDGLVDGTPCAVGVQACVSLKQQLAWLIENDQVTTGPVKIATGGPGKETPVGEFVVQWKNKNHVSSEYKTPEGKPSPMPYAVFFAEGGVAFHQGTLNRASAGCVRLDQPSAVLFYDTLQLGDKVQVK